MDIKPIETEYNGYRFRSRLEARWAVFFDYVGADWQYEPEGYQLSDGTMYLPDFYIKNIGGRGAENMFIEVKGILTQKDLHKIELFSKSFPIIIFGKIPDSYDRALDYSLNCIDPLEELFYNLTFSEGDYYWGIPAAAKGGGLVLDYPDNPYEFVDRELTDKAYKAARQARFEHGEKPNKGGMTYRYSSNDPR